MLALTPTARIADEMGRRKTRPTKIAFSPASFARTWRHTWWARMAPGLWAIDTTTVKPDPAVLNNPVDLGTGSLNVVGSIYADVLGLLPLDSSWTGVRHSQKTFQDLYGSVVSTSVDEYDLVQRINARGAFLASKAAFRGCGRDRTGLFSSGARVPATRGGLCRQ
jgi:hypothetical protein